MNDTLFAGPDAATLDDSVDRFLADHYTMSILGGSNEIQRNVVAKAVLGIR